MGMKDNITAPGQFQANRFNVDRSERIGEDTTLTDRVHAAAAADSNLDPQAAEIFEELEFKQRQSKRKALKSAMDDVKELVDDDLEF